MVGVQELDEIAVGGLHAAVCFFAADKLDPVALADAMEALEDREILGYEVENDQCALRLLSSRPVHAAVFDWRDLDDIRVAEFACRDDSVVGEYWYAFVIGPTEVTNVAGVIHFFAPLSRIDDIMVFDFATLTVDLHFADDAFHRRGLHVEIHAGDEGY